ncbi:MAG: PGF-pre-PGF domain-containing protein [Halobacteria archaeon]|nr:PGF-pre-PGF domain-containing protein [Halobacteria archaeon]
MFISPSSEPTDAPKLQREGLEALAYYRVNTSTSKFNIVQPTFKFTLNKSILGRYGAQPEDVSLYHNTGSSWTKVSTKVTGLSYGFYRYTAKATSLSTFAVGVKKPPLDISTSLPDTEPYVFNTTWINTTVTNKGDAKTHLNLRLGLDGKVVETKELSVSPGESTTHSFKRQFTEPGKYNISLNGNMVGTLNVRTPDSGSSGSSGSTSSADNQGSSDGGSTSGGMGIPLGWTILVGVIVVWMLLMGVIFFYDRL